MTTLAPARQVRGTPAGSGRAAGPLLVLPEARPAPAVSARRFEDAARLAAGELRRVAEHAPEEGRAILEGQALIAEDPGLGDAVRSRVAGGASLDAALDGAIEEQARRLEALPDPYLRQRASDVREVGFRLRAALAGAEPSRLRSLAAPSIVVARDLSPAEVLAAPAELLLGIVTEEGGRTAHAAIVARELGIPAVMAAQGAVAAATAELWGEVDGDEGTLTLLDEEPRRRGVRSRVALDARRLPVRLMANVSSATAAAAAAAAGAQGVGLFRTEMLFLGREGPLPEQEQAAVYSAACAALAPSPVVVRSLDAGSDKPLPYLEQEAEPNPALGRRGLRLWLRHEELWRPQARALIRTGAEHPNLEVMFPMVGAPEEMAEARALFEREAAALGLPVPKLGMMVELPAAIAGLDAFAGLASFVSLGTNDLTQYTLGVDRTLGWEPYLGEFSPGVLRLIAQALSAARRLGMEAGVCGELAGDPEGAVFLAGAGAGSLSMALDSMPAVAAELRRRGMRRCRAAARAALAARTAEEARAALCE